MNDWVIEKKVLFIDDEEPVLKVYGLLARRAGYLGYCSANGEDALKVFADEHIRVVFTDVRMPAMDGITLCRRVVEQDPQAQVFAVSGYVGAYSDEQFAQAGFTGYIQKPFRCGDIIAVCEQAFEELR